MTPSKAFFIALTFIAAGDLVRALLPAQQVDVDLLEPGFIYRHVRLIGLPHLELARGYTIRTYRGYSGSAVFDELISVKPWALVPLNRPERAGGKLVVAEIPLGPEGLPIDFDPNAIEFEGLAGPFPEEVADVAEFDSGYRITRLQVGGAPSRILSLVFLAWSACFLWLVIGREKLPPRSTGLSRVTFLAAVPFLLWLVVMRLRATPEANEVATWASVLILSSMIIGMAFVVRKTPSSHVGPALSEDAYRAALEAQDRVQR